MNKYKTEENEREIYVDSIAAQSLNADYEINDEVYDETFEERNGCYKMCYRLARQISLNKFHLGIYHKG